MKIQRGLWFEKVTKDALNEVVELLNGVTLKLLEKNINQWQYPWDERVIAEDILNDRLIAIKSEEKIIGVFSIKEINNFFDITSEDKAVLYVYRIAVDVSLQGKDIGALMLNYCKEYCKDEGKEMYLDCWQGNKTLRNFYENQGLGYINDYREEDFFVSVYKF